MPDEIYEIFDPSNPKFKPLIDYESNIPALLTKHLNKPPDITWKHFLATRNLSHRIYPYYIVTSDETIRIEHSQPPSDIVHRPLMIKDNRRHTATQLKTLRTDEIFTIEKLSKIENW